ncbi:ABC transporter substrate-binding protein [Treponema porcinum]|uniref:ABC transporter substrate-binding protein n=1 Tax=Treponema porcinum TaxID=261392 RepID=UPI003F112C68
MKKNVCAAVLAAALLAAFTGCSKKNGADENSIHGKIGGKIIVLTNRTDIVDTKLQEYKKAFEKKYPGTTVEFEAITDYEGTVRTRMATPEYGDVLCQPSIKSIDFPSFFEPLGTVEDFSKKFDFTNTAEPISYNGIVYSYPLAGVIGGGIVYNKSVFKKAGVKVPRSTEEFYKALEAIKAKTDAVPIFMNYPSGWTLNQWEEGLMSVSGDVDYKNNIIHIDRPFVPGDAHYELYKVMYEVVKRGLCERDILSSDWELSKQMLADGKIGCMVLGSWAISQMKALAANPDDIGYMPFPAEINGKKYAEAKLDMPLCINKHSKNKATAYAWIQFMSDDTDWVSYLECIPAKKGQKYPGVLEAFEELGVTYIEGKAAVASEEGFYDQLDKDAEIGFRSDPEKKRIIDAAMGTTSETFESIMDDWNKKWAKARKDNNIK